MGKGGGEWCKGAPDTPSCACGALQLKHEALMVARRAGSHTERGPSVADAHWRDPHLNS